MHNLQSGYHSQSSGGVFVEKMNELTQNTVARTDLGKFMAYMEWRKVEHERLKAQRLTVPTQSQFARTAAKLFATIPLKLRGKKNVIKTLSCSCMNSLSWASSVHDIAFHVCKEHAEQFGISYGPYWQDEVRAIVAKAKESAH